MAQGNRPTNYQAKGEVGASGTYIVNGLITGEEYNRKLTGQLALKVWEQMRRSDPTVAAILRAVKYPIMAAEYDVEAASDSTQDMEIADFVSNNLFKTLNWHEIIRNAFLMFDFGHEVMEKVYDLDPITNKWQLIKLAHRKASSIRFWSTIDNEPGIRQLIPGTFENVSIPRDKLVFFINDKEGDNFEGISLLRGAYMPYYFKTSLIKVQAIGLEKQSVGVPFIKPPTDNASPEDIKKAKEGAANMRTNEAAYVEIPKDWEVGFMDMKAGTTHDPSPAIAYHDRQISKSVLAQFLDLGSHGSGGSRAVSSDQTSLFNLSLEAAAQNFVHTLNEEVIKQLVDLNWSNVEAYPTLTFSKIGDDNIAVMADAVQKLMSAGALSQTAETEQVVRKTLHFPELNDDQLANYDELKRATPGAAPAPTPAPDATPTVDPKDDPNNDPQPPADKAEADALIHEARDMQERLLKSVDGIYARQSDHNHS